MTTQRSRQLLANNTSGTETHTLKLAPTFMTTHRQVLHARTLTLFTSQSTTAHTIQKPKPHASNTLGMNRLTPLLVLIPTATRTLTDAPAPTHYTSVSLNMTTQPSRQLLVNNTSGTETHNLKLAPTFTTTHRQVLPALMLTLFTSQSTTAPTTPKHKLLANNTLGMNRLTPLLVHIPTTTQTPTAAQAQILCTSLFPNMTIQHSRQLHASNTYGTETHTQKLAPTFTTTHRQVLPAQTLTLFTSPSTTAHTIRKPKPHASNSHGTNRLTPLLELIPTTTRTLTVVPALTQYSSSSLNMTTQRSR